MVTFKRNKKMVFVVFVIMLLVVILGLIAVFLTNTYSASRAHSYCCENSETASASFQRIEPISLPNYALWVSTNTDSESQELFIFRKSYVMGYDTGRLLFVNHIVSDAVDSVGSVLFEVRDNAGKKTGANAMVFFSSNPDGISKYKMNLQETPGYITREGTVPREEAFAVVVSNLGTVNHTVRLFESASFYDREDKLICEIVRK